MAFPPRASVRASEGDAMTDPVAAPLCAECGKPLDMMTVGLNGKDYHLQCLAARLARLRARRH